MESTRIKENPTNQSTSKDAVRAETAFNTASVCRIQYELFWQGTLCIIPCWKTLLIQLLKETGLTRAIQN